MADPKAKTDDPWEQEAANLQQSSAAPGEQADTSMLGTLGREVSATGKAIYNLPGSVIHAFKDEPTLDEKMMYEPKMGGAKIDDGSLRHRLGLGIARLTSQPVDIADEAYRNHRVGYEDALGVAPEAIGSASGNMIAGKVGEIAIRNAPKAIDAISKVPSAVKKIPTAIGRIPPGATKVMDVAAGGAVGHVLGHPIEGAAAGRYIRPISSAVEAIGKRFPQTPPAEPTIPNPVRQPLWDKAGTTPTSASDVTGGIDATNPPEPTGQRPIAQVATSPAPVQVPKIGDFAKQVVKAAGGNPEEPNITPGKPIASRPIAVAPAAPKDMTPVDDAPKGIPQETPELKPVDSSALSGYHYDPQTQTMTIGTKSGGMYRYGEVTPEEASAFDSADSKGKAFKDIRDNHVQTAKMVGEKWVSGKPSAVTASPDSDVVQVKPLTPRIATSDPTDTLKKSIEIAKAKKK